MEYVYTPKECKAETPTWEGTVTVKSVTFDEACDLSEKLILSVEEAPEKIRDTRRLREAVKAATPLVLGVSLKRLRDGREFKSWAELLTTTETKMLADIANAALNGPDAGNA